MTMGRSSISIEPVTEQVVGILEVINNDVLPLKYSKKYYRELAQDEDLASLAYYDQVPVAGLSLTFGQSEDIYIRTLAVLPNYRRRGVGRALIEHAGKFARSKGLSILSVHVWTEHVESLDFYTRIGFEKVKLVNYYVKLKPSTAWLMRYTVEGDK